MVYSETGHVNRPQIVTVPRQIPIAAFVRLGSSVSSREFILTYQSFGPIGPASLPAA